MNLAPYIVLNGLMMRLQKNINIMQTQCALVEQPGCYSLASLSSSYYKAKLKSEI